MNPFPGNQSVLILDNCAIHKTEALREIMEAAGKLDCVQPAHINLLIGMVLLYLPAYSPDFNPIEESFSAVKAWIRRHYRQFQDSAHPQLDLHEACASITAEKARAFFAHSGYDV